MRATRLYIVVVFLFGCTAAQSQVHRRRNTNWIFPREQDEVYRTNNYEVTERSCSNDERPLCVFIRRDFDKKPILLYMHHRAVDVTLGHRKQLVLINDYFSTKLVKVMTYKDWWYSVNSQTGRVLREFRTNRIPQKWW
jgi:hypothetical protein